MEPSAPRSSSNFHLCIHRGAGPGRWPPLGGLPTLPPKSPRWMYGLSDTPIRLPIILPCESDDLRSLDYFTFSAPCTESNLCRSAKPALGAWGFAGCSRTIPPRPWWMRLSTSLSVCRPASAGPRRTKPTMWRNGVLAPSGRRRVERPHHAVWLLEHGREAALDAASL